MPDQPKTRRAEPIQPDKPGLGNDVVTDADSHEPEEPLQPGRLLDPAVQAASARTREAKDAKRQQTQSKTALENVRDGYGGL